MPKTYASTQIQFCKPLVTVLSTRRDDDSDNELRFGYADSGREIKKDNEMMRTRPDLGDTVVCYGDML